MGPLVALLALVGAMVFWAFFYFQPRYVNAKQLKAYNACSMLLVCMVCGAYALNINVALGETEEGLKYKDMFLWGGVLAIESVFLFVLFIARNFWIFRPRTLGVDS